MVVGHVAFDDVLVGLDRVDVVTVVFDEEVDFDFNVDFDVDLGVALYIESSRPLITTLSIPTHFYLLLTNVNFFYPMYYFYFVKHNPSFIPPFLILSFLIFSQNMPLTSNISFFLFLPFLSYSSCPHPMETFYLINPINFSSPALLTFPNPINTDLYLKKRLLHQLLTHFISINYFPLSVLASNQFIPLPLDETLSFH